MFIIVSQSSETKLNASVLFQSAPKRMFNMGKAALLASVLEKTGLGRALSVSIGQWNGLVVFNYHRVGDGAASSFDRALWSASCDEFDEQVAYLKRHFDIVSSNDLDDLFEDPKRRGVMITFDDGYRDNFELAYPVLQRHDVPATFFITSGFLDERHVSWWDEIAWMVNYSKTVELNSPVFDDAPLSLEKSERRETIETLLRKFKTLSDMETELFLSTLAIESGAGRCPDDIAKDVWMTWDMVRTMDQNGMEIGGHTVSHPVLSRCTEEVQRDEINSSKARIEAEIGHEIHAFSYPVGQRDSFTPMTKQLLAQAGYNWGFSFFGGFCDGDQHDHFDMPRVPVSPHVTEAMFHATANLPWIFA